MCLMWNFTELLRWFIFVNKAIYSQLQNNLLIIQRGEKKPELIIVQYRINGQRGEDFNTLKCRNNCEINFCRIYYCDLQPWSQKCFAKWRKSNFSSKNPMISKNIQKCDTFHKICSAKIIFWTLNCKNKFHKNLFRNEFFNPRRIFIYSIYVFICSMYIY